MLHLAFKLTLTLTLLTLQPCWECLGFSSTPILRMFYPCVSTLVPHPGYIPKLQNLAWWCNFSSASLCVCLTPLFFDDRLRAWLLLCEWINVWQRWLLFVGFLTQLLWKPGSVEWTTDNGLGVVSVGNCFQWQVQPWVCYVTGDSGQARTLTDSSNCPYLQSFQLGTWRCFFVELLSTHRFAWNIWNAVKLLSASQIRTRHLESST